jgi:hypothetical protein
VRANPLWQGLNVFGKALGAIPAVGLNNLEQQFRYSSTIRQEFSRHGASVPARRLRPHLSQIRFKCTVCPTAASFSAGIMQMSYMLAVSIGLFSASLVHGQDKPTRLTFDVMSIKPWKPGQPGGGITTLPGGQEYRARGTAVIGMISVIYRISIPQVGGGPDWIKTDHWNIDAKADHGGYNLDQLHEMYRNMLADRFKLKFHRETREGSVYLLTIDKSGLKMKVDNSPEPLKG